MSTERFSYVFVWHSLSDACPKCQRLNGREWHDQDIHQDRLWDPFEGDLWDFHADQTLTHPNCRCQLEVRVDVNWEAVDGLTTMIAYNQLFGG